MTYERDIVAAGLRIELWALGSDPLVVSPVFNGIELLLFLRNARKIKEISSSASSPVLEIKLIRIDQLERPVFVT